MLLVGIKISYYSNSTLNLILSELHSSHPWIKNLVIREINIVNCLCIPTRSQNDNMSPQVAFKQHSELEIWYPKFLTSTTIKRWCHSLALHKQRGYKTQVERHLRHQEGANHRGGEWRRKCRHHSTKPSATWSMANDVMSHMVFVCHCSDILDDTSYE